MSICNTCYSVDNIPYCPKSISFGTVNADSDYYVWIKNIATNSIWGLQVTSDEAGVVTVDGVPIDPRLGYEVWLTAVGDAPNGQAVDITIGTDTFTCIVFTTVLVDGYEGTTTQLTP